MEECPNGNVTLLITTDKYNSDTIIIMISSSEMKWNYFLFYFYVGCGAKVRWSKMSVHETTCPMKPKYDDDDFDDVDD